MLRTYADNTTLWLISKLQVKVNVDLTVQPSLCLSRPNA